MASLESQIDKRVELPQKSPYSIITDVFKQHRNECLEIELLGPEVPLPEGQLILQDQLCIGIPKKTLARAFVEARALFQTRHGLNISSETLQRATTVLLLFDPEHLTAANFRKQHITKRNLEHLPSEELQEIINLELIFLDSILTSPLHRQSKSPTLWYHRFWLVSRCDFRKQGQEGDACVTNGSLLIDRETAAVLKSAERHPHNYYAWQYLRRLLGVVLPHLSRAEDEQALKNMQTATLAWVLRHPSDISGWSFLSHVLLHSNRAASSQTVRAITDIQQFAERVAWKGEGLHNFLKEAKDWMERENAQTGEGGHKTNHRSS